MTPAETLAEVVRRVLVPGVCGGELLIEKPFGPKAARAAAEAIGGLDPSVEQVRLDQELGAGALERGDEAVLRRLRRLSIADASTVVPRIDGAVVMLAALLHDVVAAFHPDLPGMFSREAPLRLLEAATAGMLEVPPVSTVRSALVRHAWLGELLRFSLVRTEVRWWVGGASFVGRQPPKRLLAWPDVRRVRRDERMVELLKLPELFVDHPAQGPLAEAHARAMKAFFLASPITDLALAGRLVPPFTLSEPASRLLAHPAGARVCRRAIALGEEGGRYAREVIAQTSAEAASLLA